jgi:hypothetical protein
MTLPNNYLKIMEIKISRYQKMNQAVRRTLKEVNKKLLKLSQYKLKHKWKRLKLKMNNSDCFIQKIDLLTKIT